MYIKQGKITQEFFTKLENAKAKERLQLYYQLSLEFEKLNMKWEQIEQTVTDSYRYKANAKTFLYRLKVAYAVKGDMTF